MANPDRPRYASMDEAIIKDEVNAVRLQQAVLCVDCDTISDSPHDACSICGSRSLLPLCRVLGERPSAILNVHEGAVQQPDAVPDAMFILTSPVTHRPRHRRGSSARRK